MMVGLVLLMIIALGVGIYVGLGMPGFPGRKDRVVKHGRSKRLPHRGIHWIHRDDPRRRG